jgi:hypothetical protein
MLRYLTPPGMFIMAFVTGWFIESTYPQGDSRNICMIIMGPAALVYAYPAIKEALLPNGGRILLEVAAFWLLLSLLSWLALYAIVAFDLFKHTW